MVVRLFKRYKLLRCVFILLILFNNGCIYRFSSIGNFTREDRVLIFAPHPDDETLGASGVIQRALKAGAKVKVVCITKGRLGITSKNGTKDFTSEQILEYGVKRGEETISAMQIAGLRRDDVIFLGYPDAGIADILTEHWEEYSPYLCELPETARVLYPDVLSPEALLIGKSLLKDIKEILLVFKPTKIFVSHPADLHPDHRALYVFLKVALFDLSGQIKQPQVFCCPIHMTNWPDLIYNKDLELNPPRQFKYTRYWWKKLELTREEVETKRLMIACYKSELKNYPWPLFIFCRKNELFGDYPVLKINKHTERERGITKKKINIVTSQCFNSLSFAWIGDYLVLELSPSEIPNKDFYIDLILLGYSKKVEFSMMPKIHIIIREEGVMVRNKKTKIMNHGVEIKYSKNIILKIPLAIINNPDYIFNCLKSYVNNYYFDATAWRIIQLD